MKIYRSILFGLCLVTGLQAQAPDSSSDYTLGDLDHLLAPIALYPDALIALILPASTAPSDVTLAARYLEADGDPAQIDDQPWDDSVKSLAHYPEVVKWMDANLDWTQAVGTAFLEQPADVMKSIQRLRVRAQAAGTLVDTPQQDVVLEDDNICIVPAQPEVIYVPVYDPDVVYVEGGPFLVFSTGYRVGPWLGYECDWVGYGVWVGAWHPGWDWRRHHYNGDAGRRWRADPRRELHQNFDRARPTSIPSPRPMAGAPFQQHRAGEKLVPTGPERKFQPDVRGRDLPQRPLPNQSRPTVPAPKLPAAPRELPGGDNRNRGTNDFNNRRQENRQPERVQTGRPGVPLGKQPSGSSDGRDKDRGRDKDKDAPQH
ncbi:MAG TPA: DUF3300 domain-containing protein [Opitutaceae bacterium]|jgi:hypothetical protein|nr:DUF3300 domain-containing protein [Opitutaceae bacterium]